MISPILSVGGYLLSWVFVLTIVVTFHEFGHFWAGKICRVKIDRFAIGFGRPLFSRVDKSGVEWRIGWIPFGGYVRFAGDENAASVPDQNDLETLRREIEGREGTQAVDGYYHFKPVWQRAFIAAAGPLASFVLAIVIFSGMAMAAGSVQLLAPRIAHVEPLSPAARAGLVPGDLILRVDDRPVRSWEDFQQFVRMHGGDSVAIDVRRQGQERTAIALLERRAIRMPVVGTTARLGYLGVGPSLTKADIITIQFTPITAVQEGFRQTGEIISSTVGYISRIFRGAENGDQFSGPLGIAHTAGAVANAAGQGAPDAATGLGRSLLALVGLAGFISAGVGFLNLLPLPVLDGGHLLFYAYEALARRPVAAHIQAIGYRVGFVLLIGLMLFASRNDLQQLGVLKFLGGLFS